MMFPETVRKTVVMNIRNLFPNDRSIVNLMIFTSYLSSFLKAVQLVGIDRFIDGIISPVHTKYNITLVKYTKTLAITVYGTMYDMTCCWTFKNNG